MVKVVALLCAIVATIFLGMWVAVGAFSFALVARCVAIALESQA